MRAVLRWLHRGIEALAVIGVLAYGAAAAVTVADILGRQFGLAVIGVVDLVQLFVVAGAWLVIPWAFVSGAHVGVDYIIAALPDRAERTVRAAAALLAGALLALMLRYGIDAYELQAMMGDRSQQIGIPIGWFWLPLLAGQAIALVAILVVIAEAILGPQREVTT